VRFFPGARPSWPRSTTRSPRTLLGPPQTGRALTFEDQYISSAGQLYELVMGHDRWTVDLRPLVDAALRPRGRTLGICSHPYDLCTELVAREAGVIVTDPLGQRLATPLDVHGDVRPGPATPSHPPQPHPARAPRPATRPRAVARDLDR
jgi:hypothetical protein